MMLLINGAFDRVGGPSLNENIAQNAVKRNQVQLVINTQRAKNAVPLAGFLKGRREGENQIRVLLAFKFKHAKVMTDKAMCVEAWTIDKRREKIGTSTRAEKLQPRRREINKTCKELTLYHG
jgi:hypothetical protein